MADEVTTQKTSGRVDHVGRSGIYPASGPAAPAGAVVRGQGELAHPEERGRRARAFGGEWSGSTALLTMGRLIFGGYFLYNGVNHFLNRQMLADYARSKQVPAPDAAVIGSGVLAALGGVSVLTGAQPKVGASMIAAFLLGVSPQMHDFWRIEDQQQRMSEFVNFTKNMALVGAACFIAAMPEPWPGSVRVREEALVAVQPGLRPGTPLAHSSAPASGR